MRKWYLLLHIRWYIYNEISRVIDIVCVSCSARTWTPQLDAASTDGALLQGRRDAEHASPGLGTAQGDVVHLVAAPHDAAPTPPVAAAASAASSPALLRLALAQGEQDSVYNDSNRYDATLVARRWSIIISSTLVASIMFLGAASSLSRPVAVY